jgi:hypothetical protein
LTRRCGGCPYWHQPTIRVLGHPLHRQYTRGDAPGHAFRILPSSMTVQPGYGGAGRPGRRWSHDTG